MNKVEYIRIKNTLSFKPNNVSSIFALGINLALLVSGLWLFQIHTIWAYLASQLILAIQLTSAYLIHHECTHDSFLHPKKLNVIIGHLMSVFTFLPFYARKYEHMSHHVWSGTFNDGAVERGLKTFNLQNSKTLLSVMNLAWKFWIPVFAINETLQIWAISLKGNTSSNKAKQRKCLSSAVFLILTYIMILYFVPYSVVEFIAMLPAIGLYFVFIEFFNLPHHLDSMIIESDKPVPLWEHYNHTKSFEPIPFVPSFLLMNFGFHTEHHFFPTLPWQNLKDAHNALSIDNPALEKLPGEFAWHLEMRKQPFDTIFKKYTTFQQKSENLYSTQSH